MLLVKPAGAPAANKHRVKLNDRFIGDLQPRSKPFLIFDSEQVGLAVQETLAEMIGTTRSRVSFFMNRFRKLGFISYNGKIEVNSSLLNAVLYDKPEIKREP